MAAGIPAGEILTLPQALQQEQVQGRDLIATFDAPSVDRNVRVVRPGFRMDGIRPATKAPPPELGADSDDILRELGLDEATIAQLKEDGTL